MKYLFIDGNNLYSAEYFATAKSKEKQENGVAVEMLNAVVSHMNRVHPDRLVVCWDGGPGFRSDLYPPYKANRPDKPDGYKRDLMSSFKLLVLAGFDDNWARSLEGDDIIATLCAKIGPEDEAVILSSDKDFCQLVSPQVAFHRRTWSKADGSGLEIMETADQVRRLMGVTPYWVTTLKAITSDASDNLPGANGIGKHRAIPLVDKYGHLEDIYFNLEEHEADFTPYVYRKMLDGREMVFLQRSLVTMKRDVPLIDLPTSKLPPPGVISKAIVEWRRDKDGMDKTHG